MDPINAVAARWKRKSNVFHIPHANGCLLRECGEEEDGHGIEIFCHINQRETARVSMNMSDCQQPLKSSVPVNRENVGPCDNFQSSTSSCQFLVSHKRDKQIAQVLIKKLTCHLHRQLCGTWETKGCSRNRELTIARNFNNPTDVG
ncbi:uncharacterized protein LOC124198371 [Daphnia pulex]|uniref:uncharacterized protein LOC124198371 n=1 Tax=Daphnia pulex TaxID=6669 RepID=UPI001EE11FE8|nr:uncharacterized protein LOC124198371 [Daphnia pulex]